MHLLLFFFSFWNIPNSGLRIEAKNMSKLSKDYTLSGRENEK